MYDEDAATPLGVYMYTEAGLSSITLTVPMVVGGYPAFDRFDKTPLVVLIRIVPSTA
jgi:hypothetical protein